MEIRINHLIEGAKRAEGLVVIIDVFRAFSLECWLFAMGAKEIRPVGAIEEALAWREKDPIATAGTTPSPETMTGDLPSACG